MVENQVQSLSGKVCPECSKASFVLSNSGVDNLENSIIEECDTYYCTTCGLEIKHIRPNENKREHFLDPLNIKELPVAEGY